MSYQLQGRILEVCDCNVLCPCWIGEDPDNGSCQGTVGWHIDEGQVNGLDVSGLTIAGTAHIPGNPFGGNWRVAFFIDDRASAEQAQALADVFSGKCGGPIADFAQLFGEVVSIERVPVTFDIVDGKGYLKIGSVIEAEMAPYHGPNGEVTTLHDSILSTIPGSPAFIAKASKYRRNGLGYGLSDVELSGKNAIQGYFHLAD